MDDTLCHNCALGNCIIKKELSLPGKKMEIPVNISIKMRIALKTCQILTHSGYKNIVK
jgi:hypothetical protein